MPTYCFQPYIIMSLLQEGMYAALYKMSNVNTKQVTKSLLTVLYF